MSIFDFVKNAGERLPGPPADPDAPTAPKLPSLDEDTESEAPTISADDLRAHLKRLDLAPDDLALSFQDGVATVAATVGSPEERERIIAALGGIAGVSRVAEDLRLPTGA